MVRDKDKDRVRDKDKEEKLRAVRYLAAVTMTVVSVSGFRVEAGQSAASELSVAERIGNRSFPSVFQAWNAADNKPGEEKLVTLARHDLFFSSADAFGLQWDGSHPGLATKFTEASICRGLARRSEMLRRNPNQILIMEIRYRDAHRSFLSDGHKWWRRDQDGNLVMGWEEGGYIQLDFSNPEYREHVARKVKATIDSGVVDGVMLDWWQDDNDRLELIKAIRTLIGDKALILANANDHKIPKTGLYINGLFMECFNTQSPERWQKIADTLVWAESNLRAPRINCLETWYHRSREDLHLMRATTTLALTRSDGYCLFSDPNPLPTSDHLHNWYEFWDVKIGRSLKPGQNFPDGTWRREFSGGLAVYNPMGNQDAEITFDKPVRSAATGRIATQHAVKSCDGDLFLHPESSLKIIK